MKKYTLLALLFAAVTCMAQIGSNAEGFLKNYEPKDSALIKPLMQNGYVLCLPGGSDAKMWDPAFDKPGGGMDSALVTNFYNTYERDENGEGKESDYRKVSQDKMEPRSFLYDIQQIQAQNPDMQVIWKVNLWLSPQRNVQIIQTLLDAGINVVAISLGNELYFVMEFDGEMYTELIEPVALQIRASFPDMDIAACFAQDVQSRQHMTFNRSVIAWIKAHPGVVTHVDAHPYLSKELSEALLIHPAYSEAGIVPIAYSSEVNTALLASYDKAWSLVTSSTYQRALIDTVRSNLPGIGLMATEYGFIPTEYYSNTLFNGAGLYYQMVTYGKEYDYFCDHNFLASGWWPKIRQGETTVQYYSSLMASQLPGGSQLLTDDAIQVNYEGKRYYPFVNMTGEARYVVVSPAQGYEHTGSFHVISGQKNYSSLGQTAFYKKQPAVVSEVWVWHDIPVFDNFIIQPYSFGYAVVEGSVVAPPNIVPTANAGRDMTVSYGTMVTLDGRTSTDSDGQIVKWTWANGSQVINGPVINVIDQVGINMWTLTVQDDDGATASDLVVITVTAPPPPVCKRKWLWFCVRASSRCNC